jgi:hypothetical protein
MFVTVCGSVCCQNSPQSGETNPFCEVRRRAFCEALVVTCIVAALANPFAFNTALQA